MLKFIHTSDWHLGQNFYGYDRSDEQRNFLKQLADIVSEQKPDALLVSGDIFHTAAPSNAAVNLYVEGLLDIHKAYPAMSIIVIAGNHDSASRLDSDKRLWELANVTVLGGIARNHEGKADLDKHIVKVGNNGFVAAVPFAYPTSFSQVGENEVGREQRQQAFFQGLLDQVESKNNAELPVVLMAHLAVNNSDFTGHDRNMTMECVEIGALGNGYDYAALGHIHRPQNLSQRARYCGTPIPVSFDERCNHSVSIVTIEAHGDLPNVETIDIKNIKPLHTIPAEPDKLDDVLKLLQTIKLNKESYIRLNVLVEQYLPNGAQEKAALAVKDRQCRFCEIKKTSTASTPRRSTQMTVEEFNKKEPIDVADQYFTDKFGQPMDKDQRDMFNYIYQLIQKENRQ